MSGEIKLENGVITKTVKCNGCGIDVPRKRGRVAYCDNCSTPEKKKGRAVKGKQNSRTRQQQAQAIADAEATSTAEVKPKEARRILEEERGIRNPRILDVCVEHAAYASRNLKIPFNASLFKKGLRGTLAAVRGEQPPAFPEDVWNPGERVREHELYCAWDYACSWRSQPDGTTLSFEDWKAYRRHCITDIVWFANTVLGKSFEQEPHGRWAEELFPQLEPALLSLPEKFGQKDIAKAFSALSDVRQRCLISARSSFKSTFSTVFMLALMLCFAGSLRILVCTATQPLAKGFAKSFRSLVMVRDPNNLSLFNQLWPEHCIAPDDGKSLEYTSPFRQLDALIEPTLFITSVISEGQAGSRYDYGNFDDCAEISNSNTPEMRAKTQERIDMLRELGEPHSLTTYIGTPISQGMGTEEDPGDLYSVLLLREEKNKKEGNDPKLLYAICPAWTLKSGVRKKAWDPTLKEDEVDLLFPSRLTFKYLMAKLKENLATDKNAKIFRQQSLVNWVPDDEEGLVVRFDHDEIWRRVKSMSFFQPALGAQTFLALDRSGGSVSRYADFNAVVVGRLHRVQDQQVLVVVDAKLERAKDSDLIVNVLVPFVIKHKPTVIIFEEDRHWADFEMNLRRELARRNIPVPWIRHTPIDITPKSKSKRIGRLELPLGSGRLYFNSAISELEACLLQLEKFDGITNSNSHRKDDFCDSLSLLAEALLPRTHEEIKEEDPEIAKQRKSREEEDYARGMRQAYNDRMFNTGKGIVSGRGEEPSRANVSTARQWGNKPTEPAPEPATPAPAHEKRFPTGGRGNPFGGGILPSGMRGGPRR